MSLVVIRMLLQAGESEIRRVRQNVVEGREI
jgi:hypothetical protein